MRDLGLAATVAALLVLAVGPARADDPIQPPGGALSAADSEAPAQALSAAGDALEAGDYRRAAALVEPLVRAHQGLQSIDLAEAYRLYGLSLYFLDRVADAEQALLRYLRLDPDAHLDPARYPPEVIVFFEDIRARHRADLAGLRERPRSTREWSKNLFPPWGQLANGHRRKAWTIAGLTAGFAVAHLSTYFLLERWCDRGTGVCKSGSDERRGTAIALQWTNLASGAALIGVLAYGVIDGFYYHRKQTRSESPPQISVGVSPTGGGGLASVAIRF